MRIAALFFAFLPFVSSSGCNNERVNEVGSVGAGGGSGDTGETGGAAGERSAGGPTDAASGGSSLGSGGEASGGGLGGSGAGTSAGGGGPAPGTGGAGMGVGGAGAETAGKGGTGSSSRAGSASSSAGGAAVGGNGSGDTGADAQAWAPGIEYETTTGGIDSGDLLYIFKFDRNRNLVFEIVLINPIGSRPPRSSSVTTPEGWSFLSATACAGPNLCGSVSQAPEFSATSSSGQIGWQGIQPCSVDVDVVLSFDDGSDAGVLRSEPVSVQGLVVMGC